MGTKEEIAKDGGEKTALDNDAKVEVEKKAPDIEEDEELPDSEGEEIPEGVNAAEGEDFSERKEAANENVEMETQNNGEIKANKFIRDVPEKVSEEIPLVKQSNGEKADAENQVEDEVVDEENDGKPADLRTCVTGMQLLKEDGTKKDGFSNGITLKIVSSGNGAKDEGLKNEVKMVKLEEPNRGPTGLPLVLHNETKRKPSTHVKEKCLKPELNRGRETEVRTPNKSFVYESDAEGYESGTEEEQAAFVHELEIFHRERGLDFKPPKFYQEQLNLLKLWRSVIKLGGYEQVTSCKVWRQVGDSFKPPKTCTTVSWTFRGFYEKTLLEFEKHKILSGELPEIDSSFTDSLSAGTQEGVLSQASGSGRARRDAAARAMQGWHSLRFSSNGEVGDPIIKDKNSISMGKREKQLKNIGLLKRPKQSPIEHAAKLGHLKSPKPQSENMVVDIGPPADWVKINVQRMKDCFEVYALVPGLLREEVRVQSDPAGRLVISGQPEHLDNPWGVTPFKKVVSLPSRIDPHQTSAVVTLHGQLFVRVPFEQTDA